MNKSCFLSSHKWTQSILCHFIFPVDFFLSQKTVILCGGCKKCLIKEVNKNKRERKRNRKGKIKKIKNKNRVYGQAYKKCAHNRVISMLTFQPWNPGLNPTMVNLSERWLFYVIRLTRESLYVAPLENAWKPYQNLTGTLWDQLGWHNCSDGYASMKSLKVLVYRPCLNCWLYHMWFLF